jgi:hypothetical protein
LAELILKPDESLCIVFCRLFVEAFRFLSVNKA